MTAVVVTYNSQDVVGECLKALASRQRHATGGCRGKPGLEVVVVDNGSRDGTEAVARGVAPRARFVSLERNAGYAAAVNAGMRCADPHADIAVLNPDIRITPDGLASLQRALHAGASERVGVVVPRLVGADGSLQTSLRRQPSVRRTLGEAVLGGDRAGRWAGWGERVTDPAVYGATCDVEWASGAALLVSRECRNDLGEWDESFFLYSEETEYFLRAADRAWRVRYVPDATAIHIGGELHSSPALWSLLIANRLRLYRSRHGRVAALPYAAAVAANELLRLGREGGIHRAGLATVLRPGRRKAVLDLLQGRGPDRRLLRD